MKVRGAIAGLVSVIVVLLSGSTCISSSKPIQTTLEKSNYTQLTSSEEILQFLDTLSQRNPGNTEMSILGASAKGKPLGALLISQKPGHFNQKLSSPSRLTVMLVGSQHGSEPSGAEALLLLSRDILEGALRHYLSVADFIVIPDSNPDGRTANRRVNGNGVNLSTNYDLLTEPECRALVDALYRWQPEVILDIHESAVLKKQSLGREGFLTDVEAQFEAANNPNVDSGIRTFTYERFLPELVAAVSAKGLPCQRYIGEITSVNQVITHAGLSLRNLRNRAGMAGCFSFLLENKLDPSTRTLLDKATV